MRFLTYPQKHSPRILRVPPNEQSLESLSNIPYNQKVEAPVIGFPRVKELFMTAPILQPRLYTAEPPLILVVLPP